MGGSASRATYLDLLYRPLLQPATFFEHFADVSQQISLIRALTGTGAVFGLVSLVVSGRVAHLPVPASGVLPEAAIVAIVITLSVLAAGLGALLFSFLPALWLHVLLLILQRGYTKNMLVSWHLVGFITVPMIVGSMLVLAIGMAPAAGGLLAGIANVILSLVAIRALYLALRVVHRSGRAAAAVASTLGVAPLLAGALVAVLSG